MMIPVMQVDDVGSGAGGESEDAGQGSNVEKKVALSTGEGRQAGMQSGRHLFDLRP